MAEIIITKDNFKEEVLDCDKPVLIDFWATWCGPCRMLAPVIEEIANERDDIKVGKVNVDEQMELALEYKVEVIPTLYYFKDGEMKKKTVGVMTKQEILDVVNSL